MFEQSENGIREENLFYYRKGVDIMIEERWKKFLVKNYNHIRYIDEKLNIA